MKLSAPREAERTQIRAFDHYNLRAPRGLLDVLRDFYCDVLGFELGARPPFRRFGYWLYAGDKPVLHLSEADVDEHRAVGMTTTFDHAAFDCRGRAEFERRLRELGIDYRVTQVPQVGLVQLFCKDPAGNGVELSFEATDGE